MSFQGDVRGIGLAELLQGLARGRKQGIVTLSSKGQPRTRIGLAEGRAYLLPDEGEAEDAWQERVRDAWLDAEGAHLESLHTAEVARANRLELLYALLDGDGAHFRFEPRTLPVDPRGAVTLDTQSQPVAPIPIESLLLEYARIADELTSVPEDRRPRPDDVPVLESASLDGSLPEALAQHVDGRSTVAEIADRLGWTLRQTVLSLAAGAHTGQLRCLPADHLLVLGVQELRRKAWRRAAVRLEAWCERGTPGGLPPEVAEELASEWGSGRLVTTVRLMSEQGVWTLLQRLDHGYDDASRSSLHWLEAGRIFRDSARIQLRRLVIEAADAADLDRPQLAELLQTARTLADAGNPRRALPLLRIAAERGPATGSERLELGLLCLQAGAPEEAAPWILAACEEFVERGLSDRAVPALRELTAALPRDREARVLLGLARRSTTAARRLRRRLGITFAGVTALVAAAAVQLGRESQRQEDLAAVRAMLDDPQRARLALAERFPEGEDGDVQELRRLIEQQQREAELSLRNAWIEDYDGVASLARKGLGLEALEAGRALPAPPLLHVLRPDWPQVTDLFAAIGTALIDQAEALGAPRLQDPDQVDAERRIAELASALRQQLAVPPAREDVALARELDRLEKELERRETEREEQRRAQEHEDLRESQNALLAAARAASERRAPAEAVAVYQELFVLDGDPRVLAALEEEFETARTRADALSRARAASLRGQPEEALALLDEHMQEDAPHWALPVRITSEPMGAEVVRDDAVLGTTPLELEVLPEEAVRLRLSAPDHLLTEVSFTGPRSQSVVLSRRPERSWASESAVDAIPVPLGEDHVVADRAGHVARIRSGGSVAWLERLDDLSGIERAPVHLPGRTGRMLLVTEGGEAWSLDPTNGGLSGPALIGSPLAGPTPGPEFVQVRASGGRFARFTDSHKPVWATGEGSLPDAHTADGPTSGMRVVRPLEGEQNVQRSPFGEWTVSFDGRVWRARHPRHADFAAIGEGRWRWYAFESRRGADLLWISDGAGLRAWSLAD